MRRRKLTKKEQVVHAAHSWLHHIAHRAFTRRVFVVAIIALGIQIMADFYHFHLFGKMGELFTASVVEHIFFNVPLLED